MFLILKTTEGGGVHAVPVIELRKQFRMHLALGGKMSVFETLYVQLY